MVTVKRLVACPVFCGGFLVFFFHALILVANVEIVFKGSYLEPKI